MSTQHWIWRSDYAIPSKTGAGRRVLDEVLRELKTRRWGKRDIFSVELAMEEALVNAITHGNRSDTNRQVRVGCRISPRMVRIEIADEGQGFDPAAVPDPTDPARLESPGGRGVMLMKAFMSRVEYNALGNHVVMEKDRGNDTSLTTHNGPVG
jgi:serine/threonine-protein kinase RsbW